MEYCLHGPPAAVMSNESKTESAKTKAVVENHVGGLKWADHFNTSLKVN